MKNSRPLAVHNEERENSLIKKDFAFVVILNLILFAAMIGLYFWNRSTGELDRLLSQLIRF